MAGFNPNRIDKGVRAAGQFTYASHAESSVTLGGTSTLTVEEAPLAAPVQAPVRTPSHAPSADQLAAIARERLTAPIRAAETVSDEDRALAAYASRTTRSGTWHDYLPDLHGGTPTRNQLMAAMRAFEDAPAAWRTSHPSARPPTPSPSSNGARQSTSPSAGTMSAPTGPSRLRGPTPGHLRRASHPGLGCTGRRRRAPAPRSLPRQS